MPKFVDIFNFAHTHSLIRNCATMCLQIGKLLQHVEFQYPDKAEKQTERSLDIANNDDDDDDKYKYKRHSRAICSVRSESVELPLRLRSTPSLLI